MKKVLVFFAIFALVSGFAMGMGQYQGPQHDGISVGGYVAVPDVTGDGDTQVNVVPFVEWSDAITDDIDLWAVLGVPMFFGGDDTIMALNFDGDFTYKLMPALSAGLYLQFAYVIIPDLSPFDPYYVTFGPWVKYTMDLGDTGSFYAKAELDMEYGGLGSFASSDIYMSLPVTLGFDAGFGLGIAVTPTIWLAPSGPDRFYGLNLNVSYDVSPIYVELNVDFPTGFEFDNGLGIGVYGEYAINDAMRVLLGVDCGNVAADKAVGELTISPRIGLKYSL